jgi:PAS domain S-box-containing protein/putative nucleotidyltransferase with HDIG domain
MDESGRYELEELLEIPRLRKLFDSLNDVFPISSAILDSEGVVLTATAWQDVCTKFHRQNEASALACRESDRCIVERIEEADPSIVYRCPHGMIEAATPIMVDGMHLGSVCVGQFLLEPPDLAFFRAQAAKYGFDEDAYLAAVQRVPVLTQGEFDRYHALAREFTEIFASLAFHRLREKEAADQGQEAVELERQLVEAAQEGIIGADADMRIVVWNRFIERLTGVLRDDVLGRPATEVFPFLEPVGVVAAFQKSLTGATCGPLEFAFEVPQSGCGAWVATTTVPLRSATGEIMGVLGTVQDITERHRDEESLRENEQRLVRAQRIAHVGNWEIDLRTRTMWASREAFRIYGIELPGPTLPLESVQAVVLPEYRESLDAALLRLTTGQGEYDETFEVRRANDGQVRVAHSMAELVRDDDGAPVSVVGALQDVTELAAAERGAVEAAARLGRMLDGTVTAMSAVVETRDPYTAGHQRRVTQIAVALAAELGIADGGLETLRLASTLHDIGRIAVPTEILTKPGRLSETEFAIIKVHSAAGAEILAPIEFDAPVADIVRWHHERLDGSGYPDGLAGEAIPLEARIIAIADVVEAMASHRPYRPALGIEAALAEIREGADRLYDADVAAACERIFAAGFAFSE